MGKIGIYCYLNADILTKTFIEMFLSGPTKLWNTFFSWTFISFCITAIALYIHLINHF